jgi:hypothetical protein
VHKVCAREHKPRMTDKQLVSRPPHAAPSRHDGDTTTEQRSENPGGDQWLATYQSSPIGGGKTFWPNAAAYETGVKSSERRNVRLRWIGCALQNAWPDAAVSARCGHFACVQRIADLCGPT